MLVKREAAEVEVVTKIIAPFYVVADNNGTMKYAEVRIHLPDWMLHPMQAFIRAEDAVWYEEMLAWRVRPDKDIAYELFYVEADMKRYREAVSEVTSIVEYQIAPIDDASAHVWACEAIRPEGQAWRGAFADRHVIVVPPIRFDDEAALEMTIVGDGEAIQDSIRSLPSDIDVTVHEIGTYDRRGGTVAGALTDRQLTAIDTASRVGYYDVPRNAPLTEVAAALDCAESTVSVLLRRAERAIISRMLNRYGGNVARITQQTSRDHEP